MRLSSILVALDPSGSTAGFKAAAELARRSSAKLQALYIEDQEWFEACQLNFTQQTSSYTGELIPLTEQHIREQSEALKARLQHVFTQYSESLKIHYSYQSVRGTINNEIMKAASQVDLVVIGRNAQPFGRRASVGSTAHFLARNSPAPVLVWNNGASWPHNVIGICTTPEESAEVIRWTFGLSRLLQRDMHLFWPYPFHIPEGWPFLKTEPGAPEAPELSGSSIRDKSEVHRHMDVEFLRSHRNAIYLVQRQESQPNISSLLEELPNSILLL
ncbi:universal stress protein [Fodinibius sediminis]|uniref:Nucleotide-binding universal stress protein, UspA family n=1 Tax=Fodinibius sediminis TaxID=1214077 RepID=A0A521CMF0_9BACT|nr:universal stress protein [Fodinibius sediminis]SMO60612.1 Nucleotide-binding universal stress protein, UspA family [Fodinibius sediminis]